MFESLRIANLSIFEGLFVRKVESEWRFIDICLWVL